MTLSPPEEAAVEAALVTVEAHVRQSGHRTHPSRSAVEALEERLGSLDWRRFDGRGYQLLREVYRRASAPSSPGGAPDEVQTAGRRYEGRYLPARTRLSRATP